jgi:hypothetical protein
MEPFKEPPRKKEPSTKSLSELMNLLMKLNARLREKFSPPPKKKENGAAKLDVIIIIMSDQFRKPGPVKNSRSSKREPLKGDWIEELCEEIERGPCTRK